MEEYLFIKNDSYRMARPNPDNSNCCNSIISRMQKSVSKTAEKTGKTETTDTILILCAHCGLRGLFDSRKKLKYLNKLT